MTEQEILQCAREEGFAAAVLGTDQIVFEPAFRRYCEENLCGQYGANYSCPPSCGTPEEMKRKVLAYRKALVLQSIWDIEDLSDLSACWRAQDKHNEAAVRVMDALRAAGHSGLMLASSGCRLCTPCAQALGQPCKHPARRYSCLSAYCVYVKALADSCGMDYDCGTGRLGLFGLYAFD